MVYERIDFYNRFGILPSKVTNLEIGESYTGKDYTLTLLNREKDPDFGFDKKLTLTDGKETFVLDLGSHWERGDDSPIKFCREGIANLIKGVYKQTAEDLTDLYCGDVSSVPVGLVGNETKEEKARLQLWAYNNEVRKCEELLGPVFSRYAKIRAGWRSGKTVSEIAAWSGETEDEVAAVIERLGFNRKRSEESEIESRYN